MSESESVRKVAARDSGIPRRLLGAGDNAGATAAVCYDTLRRMRRRVDAHAAALDAARRDA